MWPDVDCYANATFLVKKSKSPDLQVLAFCESYSLLLKTVCEFY